MKSLCKETQRVLTAFNGDVNRLRKQHPELAEHLKNCRFCQMEAEKIKQMFVLLAGQRLRVQNEEFWADFENGLYRKLQRPRKSSLLQRIRSGLNQILRGLFFQPAYRVGLAFAVLFLVSYLGYYSVGKQAAGAIDSYDYLYESYQEASDSNPIFQSFSDPADQLIEIADVSGEGK